MDAILKNLNLVDILSRMVIWARTNRFVLPILFAIVASYTGLESGNLFNLPSTINIGGTHIHNYNQPQPQQPSGSGPRGQLHIQTASGHHPNLPLVIAGWKLALQLPIAFCHEPVNRFQCGIPIPKGVTIHGMYALDGNGKSFPPSEPSAVQLEQNDISGLEEKLKKHWPQLLNRRTNIEFWSYEYSKHGVPTRLGPRDYFSLAISLKEKIDESTQGIESLFRRSMVFPGSSYNPDFFCRSLTTSTKLIDIKCTKNYEGVVQLQELQFCYGPDKAMLDCSSNPVCEQLDCEVPTLYPSYSSF